MADWSCRRVLITGAGGFIGANLVRTLLEHGAEVHVLVRASTSTWRLDDVLNRVTLHRSDLTDREAVRAAFAGARPQVVVNLAVQGVRLHQRNDPQIIVPNVSGMLSVLEAAAEA